MVKKNDIIVLYGPTWDQPAQLSKHQFSKLWSKDRKVLYIESPPNLLSFFTRKNEFIRLLKRNQNGPIEVDNNIWVTTFINIFPFRGSKYLFGSELVNSINQALIINRLKSYIEKLKLNNPILFISTAHAYPILKYFPNSSKIYHCSDDYTLIPSFPQSFKKLESKLIKECDLVVTTAKELEKVKKEFNKNTISIPNGANIEHFKRTFSPHTQIPEDMKVFKKPIVGYIGSVFRYINEEWVAFAAEELPEYDFVFIGPISIDIKDLNKRDNIHFLGKKSYSLLPEYLKSFSVATIPFVIDGVTLKASPIKFYEYLASGVPIVSTELPDLDSFHNYAFLVKDKFDFARKIKFAINNDDIEKIKSRKKFSKNFSWENRFEQ